MNKNHIFDKNGRVILPNDILKVYHYIAARRRQKKYMYFVAGYYVELGREKLGEPTHLEVFQILNPTHYESPRSHYIPVGVKLVEYEIVSGLTTLPGGHVESHDERPKEGKNAPEYFVR